LDETQVVEQPSDIAEAEPRRGLARCVLADPAFDMSKL
jgi:hypothetical protein